MKINFSKHFRYYSILLFMQVLGLFVITLLAGKRELQTVIIVTSTIGYVAFAIIHQRLEHSLTGKIVVEYLLFGLFGLIASLFFFR